MKVGNVLKLAKGYRALLMDESGTPQGSIWFERATRDLSGFWGFFRKGEKVAALWTDQEELPGYGRG